MQNNYTHYKLIILNKKLYTLKLSYNSTKNDFSKLF